MSRGISEVISAPETAEGAGAMVKRALPYGRMTFVDPFVLLDEFFVRPPAAFPEHPHRGFEIVTYILDGSFRHADTLGNDSTVLAGGLQRITAGAGIRHSEMPASEGLNHGLQLWINLPRALKGIEPGYQGVPGNQIPEASGSGYRVRTIVGPGSPVDLRTPVRYYDVALDGGAVWQEELPGGYGALLYVLQGSVSVGDRKIAGAQMGILDGDKDVRVLGGEDGARFALIAGKPHGETVRFNGPFVD